MIFLPLKSSLKSTLRSTASRFSLRNYTRRFRDDERGIAAIEFAIIAPIMIGMYFGLAEIAHALSTDRKISHGTNVAGDLATQQPEIVDDGIEEIISAALRVMDIPDVQNVSIDIESFILPAAGQPAESQGRIRLNNAISNFDSYDTTNLDTKLLNENSGVVVTRVRYKYTPIEARFFDTTVTLEETFLLKPRRSDLVTIQNGAGSLVDCGATHYSNVLCSVTASTTP